MDAQPEAEANTPSPKARMEQDGGREFEGTDDLREERPSGAGGALEGPRGEDTAPPARAGVHVASRAKRGGPDPENYWEGPVVEPPPCSPLECSAEPEMTEGAPDVGVGAGIDDDGDSHEGPEDQAKALHWGSPRARRSEEVARTPPPPPPPPPPIQCTAGGKRPQESDFRHCPTPQSYVRCGPHHRAELRVLAKPDVEALHDIWWRYRDDLTWPWYEKKPQFADSDFNTLREKAQKVVDAMVQEYGEAMVLDQATISNTNHIGHPPHADNVQFDSVWWHGKRIRREDEVTAAREGAYVLWRPEKTSYRSYSCTVSLCDPNGYEGGEVQFFGAWGEKDPIESYKCEEGCGIAFCGCQRNIHAVTGVKHGFRLVFLVWTRPPRVVVPESQRHVCYFRPGTGLGVWLTTADLFREQRKRHRNGMQIWLPKEEDDDSCQCLKCIAERKKLSWKECCEAVKNGRAMKQLPPTSETTPTTSAETTPRNKEPTSDFPPCESPQSKEARNDDPSCPSPDSVGSESEDEQVIPRDLQHLSAQQHCPHPQGRALCKTHERLQLQNVLTKADMRELKWLWETHQDNLTSPWYDKKPTFTDHEFITFRRIAQKVVDAMIEVYKEPLVLDQATISNSNHLGHPPHADNVQFESVWWGGRQIKQRDELVAARGGAEVLWKDAKTCYRNYSATVALSDPSQFGGGELEFYNCWGEKKPSMKCRPQPGCGMAFCGCQRNIHAVTGVKWGFRLVLLIWTRPPDAEVPEDQTHVCYFRPGTGLSVWLTTADLEDYPKYRQKRQKKKKKSWVPVASPKEDEWAEEEEEEDQNDETPLSPSTPE